MVSSEDVSSGEGVMLNSIKIRRTANRYLPKFYPNALILAEVDENSGSFAVRLSEVTS